MITVEFHSASPIILTATLTLGTWSAITAVAADGIPQPVLNLDLFSTTELRVVNAANPSLAVQVNEDVGNPMLRLRVLNQGGSALTIIVPGSDTVTLDPGQSVEVTYNR